MRHVLDRQLFQQGVSPNRVIPRGGVQQIMPTNTLNPGMDMGEGTPTMPQTTQMDAITALIGNTVDNFRVSEARQKQMRDNRYTDEKGGGGYLPPLSNEGRPERINRYSPTSDEVRPNVVNDSHPSTRSRSNEEPSNQVNDGGGIAQLVAGGDRVDYEKELAGLVSDKPYSNWDYVRDMSAGLLASKDPNFLGGLGEASLYSNKARDKAEASNEALKAKIKIASTKSKDSWAKLDHADAVKMESYLAKKRDAAKAAGLAPPEKGELLTTNNTMVNGIKTEAKTYMITEADARKFPHARVRRREDGTLTVTILSTDDSKAEARQYKKREDIQKGINDYMVKPEALTAHTNAVGSMYDYKDVPMLGIEDSEAWSDWIGNVMEWDDEIGNQIQKAIDNGDGLAAQSFINSKLNMAGLAASGRRLLESGPLSELTAADHKQMGPLISRISKEMAADAWDKDSDGDYSPVQFVDKALRYILPKVKWDLDGMDRFDIVSTEKQITDEQALWESQTGQGFFNLQEGTPNYSLSDKWLQGTFQLPGENQAANKSQWDLLSRHGKRNVMRDSRRIKNILERKLTMPAAQATEDVMHSFVEGRNIWGGKDITLSGDNEESLYTPSETWTIEPQYYDGNGDPFSVADLRANKILWSGFDGGKWIYYDETTGTKRRKTITPRDKNGDLMTDLRSFDISDL